MSYDIDLKIPACSHCGRGPTTVFSTNYTSNCSGMWFQAGLNLLSLEGKKAGDCLAYLSEGIACLEADPARFQAMNPVNGWGDYATTLAWLREIQSAMAEHPQSIVRVSC